MLIVCCRHSDQAVTDCSWSLVYDCKETGRASAYVTTVTAYYSDLVIRTPFLPPGIRTYLKGLREGFKTYLLQAVMADMKIYALIPIARYDELIRIR